MPKQVLLDECILNLDEQILKNSDVNENSLKQIVSSVFKPLLNATPKEQRKKLLKNILLKLHPDKITSNLPKSITLLQTKKLDHTVMTILQAIFNDSDPQLHFKAQDWDDFYREMHQAASNLEKAFQDLNNYTRHSNSTFYESLIVKYSTLNNITHNYNKPWSFIFSAPKYLLYGIGVAAHFLLLPFISLPFMITLAVDNFKTFIITKLIPSYKDYNCVLNLDQLQTDCPHLMFSTPLAVLFCFHFSDLKHLSRTFFSNISKPLPQEISLRIIQTLNKSLKAFAALTLGPILLAFELVKAIFMSAVFVACTVFLIPHILLSSILAIPSLFLTNSKPSTPKKENNNFFGSKSSFFSFEPEPSPTSSFPFQAQTL